MRWHMLQNISLIWNLIQKELPEISIGRKWIQLLSITSTESFQWPSKWAEMTLRFTIVGPKIFTDLSVKCTFKVFWKCFFKVSDSLQPQGLQHARFLCPWNSPVKNIRVGCHSLLQGIFLTQGSNPGLLHCRWILHHLSHQGSPLNPPKSSV